MRKISITTLTMLTALAFAATASAGDDKTAKKPDATKDAAGAKDAGAKDAAAGDDMAMPDPAPELLAAAKGMKGTWSCKGNMMDMKGQAMAAKGTMKWSLDLDKMWIKGALSINKMKGQKRGYKGTFYRTFSNGTWSHLTLDNMGGWGSSTSKGPDADGKTTFEGTGNMGGMTYHSKDYEQPGEKKGTWHMWGEMSMDGKQWMPGYDMTCSK